MGDAQVPVPTIAGHCGDIVGAGKFTEKKGYLSYPFSTHHFPPASSTGITGNYQTGHCQKPGDAVQSEGDQR